MGRTTIVILEVTDDVDRPWYDAIGLPPPHAWNIGADIPEARRPGDWPPTDDVHVRAVAEYEVTP